MRLQNKPISQARRNKTDFFFSVGMKYGVTQGVFSSKPIQEKKILVTCRSKFVCRFPAVLISSKSTIQGLVNKFLIGYLLENNREYTTCSFIRNIGLYRNAYSSIFVTVLLREYSLITIFSEVV
jgi:hypothetical protein